jgi:hypothetical protein
MAHSLRQAHRLPETPPLPGTLTSCPTCCTASGDGLAGSSCRNGSWRWRAVACVRGGPIAETLRLPHADCMKKSRRGPPTSCPPPRIQELEGVMPNSPLLNGACRTAISWLPPLLRDHHPAAGLTTATMHRWHGGQQPGSIAAVWRDLFGPARMRASMSKRIFFSHSQDSEAHPDRCSPSRSGCAKTATLPDQYVTARTS